MPAGRSRSMADEARKFSKFLPGRRREEAEAMGNCCAAPRTADFFKRTRNLRCEGDDSEGFAVDLGFLACVLGDGASGGEDLRRRYVLGEELGRGEFGVTRRCEDLETGEVLACKSISKRKLRTAVDVEDVRREVEIMRALPPHPHIVRFRNAFEDAEAVHIVMDLCDGGELFARIIAEGCFGERAAAGFVRTIIEVVQHCHSHGVAHRDLKPENFLFVSAAEDSQLKAIDFGLSIFFQPGDRFNDIVGSPYYMAPEVLRKNYGPEADIWSAGVILYIMLCGYPPFWGDTDDEIARSIVRSSYSLEIEPWPSISEDAKDLVSCMLDPDPYTRFTADEVLDHPWIRNSSMGSEQCREGIEKIIGESICDSEALMIVETAMSYLDKNNRSGYVEVEVDELRDVLGERYQIVWNIIVDAREDKKMRISCEELKTRIMALSTNLNPDCKPSSLRCYSAEVLNSLTPRLFDDDGSSHR